MSDVIFMKRALKLACKARGKIGTNPMVGAVFVKNNKIIAEGYHKKIGSEHAEVVALKNLSKEQIKNGTLYVTLEPCNHFGRTAPCSDFLIRKNVKNIVIAMKDPNLLTYGKSILKLKKNGIKIKVGLLKKEAELLNEAFIYSIKSKMPFVILKTACSINGKITDKNNKWISNEKSRKYVHKLRNDVDAILTTSQTILKDDSHLGVRMIKGKDPFRIILDSKLRTSISSKVYRDKNVLVIATETSSKQKRLLFEKAGIAMKIYPEKIIPLKKIFKDIYKMGIGTILVEAGAKLTTSILQKKLVSKVYFFVAQRFIGSGITLFEDFDMKKIDKVLKLKNKMIEKIDDDILVKGYL